MRFMALWYPAQAAAKPPPEHFAAMEGLIRDMRAAKALVDTGGWDPHSPALRLRSQDGAVSVTDGPFAEAKEVVGGFVIMDVAKQAEAVAWATRFMKIAGDGRCEMRELPPPHFGS